MLYAAFVWVELVFYGSSVPSSIAFLVLSYSVITWIGIAVFGKDTWLQGGEAFSVFFGILGRFAPTEVRVKTPRTCRECGACGVKEEGCANCYECFAKAPPEERELDLRPPAIGLARPEQPPPGGLVFVILMLAGVAYDGLLATRLWLKIVRLTPLNQTLGLFVLPVSFLAVYLGFVKLSPAPWQGWGVSRAACARLLVLARANRDRLPGSPLPHVPAHPGTGNNLLHFGSIRLGAGSLRHRGLRDP